MATLRPAFCSSRAKTSTTGVLPVPPTVRLPTLMTWQPSVWWRKIPLRVQEQPQLGPRRYRCDELLQTQQQQADPPAAAPVAGPGRWIRPTRNRSIRSNRFGFIVRASP